GGSGAYAPRLAEPRRRSLVRPVAGRKRVIMERQHVELVVRLHDLLGPRIVLGRRTDRDGLRPLVLPDERREDAEQRRILIGGEIAAAAPRLIDDAGIIDSPWLLASVGAAKVRQCRSAVRGHIFDPVLGFAGGAGADIDAEECFRPDQLGEVEELMRSEGVAFLTHALLDARATRRRGVTP